ncbi:MAG: hypothetical protein ACK4HR_03630 [Hyphomonas sp.]|jgi:hypothetical protein
MIRNSALMAFAFGILLAIGEIVRNWNDWQPWPFWIVDFIAAGALIWGAVRTLSRGSSRLLSAAWGFTAGIFWMSFFSHAASLNGPAPETHAGGLPGEAPLTLIIGMMLLAAIAGLVMSLTRRAI